MTGKRVALVTGGSRGIGRAICTRLAAQCGTLAFNFLSDINGAQETARAIEAQGARPLQFQGSVADPDFVSKMFAELQQRCGRLDVLVNNVGILRPGFLMMFKDSDWHETMATNLTGNYLCSKAAFRLMVENKFGRIIHISSTAGLKGLPGQIAYAASKGAINAMTTVMAKEGARFGVNVNAVAPGFVETDMTLDLGDKATHDALNRVPIHRPALPAEVAELVAYLAGDGGAYITGQTYVIDGGLTIS
jgi:3-oxoacyl-[acyl-carrier protein] reductase